MDLTRASKKYQEYCREKNTNYTTGQSKLVLIIIIHHVTLQKKEKYVTLSSLLLVRKSVEGFRIAVIALASSSCTVRVVDDVYGSVLNTNCIRHISVRNV